MDLSILIPSRNEMFLARTIQDILEHIEGKTEIIAVLDGYKPDPPLTPDPRVILIYNPESVGQRAATNEAAKLSKAKYLMKCDAHCAFDKGFDVKMIGEMYDDWTMVPIMRNLHAFDWVCSDGHRRYQGPSGPCKECGKETTRDVVWIPKTNPSSKSYCFDSTPHFQYFGEYTKRPEGQGDTTETMSLQGSCWMLTRDKYWELGICDETFGSWGSQGIEVAVKTWLSGGRVIVNKKTWYAHMFRTQGGDFGFPYQISGAQQEKAKSVARDLFFNNKWDKQVRPLSWLVEKFWPVKGWTEEDLRKLKANTFQFKGAGSDIKPAESEPTSDGSAERIIFHADNQSHKGTINIANAIMSKSELKKGIIYYTDCQLDENIAKPVRDQLSKISQEKNISIVSATLKKMDFGVKNIHFPSLKRGYLTMFKQIMSALEHSTADIIFFCFQGDTYIETINGLKRIDEIKKGELVKTHLNRFKPVTNVFKTTYLQRKPLIQIDTKHSYVRCTPEHPFYVIRNSKKQWIQADQITKGDTLLYPNKKQEDYLDLNVNLKSSSYGGRYGSTDRRLTSLKIDEKLARFMGLYAAEGHFNGKNGIGFTFSNDEKEYQDFIKEVCLGKFGRAARERKTWATQILINISELGPKFREWFGKGARDKHIPEFVFDWSLKNRLSFILGLLNGDAAWHKRYNFYVSLSSASKSLIEDTIRLMNESGVGWDNATKTAQNKG
ncbi:glycosyltransferase, partial [Candidatus Microgenomates bacterium]|nr:glycosyltransferase [Candidatus Microgenomates bacterium]